MIKAVLTAVSTLELSQWFVQCWLELLVRPASWEERLLCGRTDRMIEILISSTRDAYKQGLFVVNVSCAPCDETGSFFLFLCKLPTVPASGFVCAVPTHPPTFFFLPLLRGRTGGTEQSQKHTKTKEHSKSEREQKDQGKRVRTKGKQAGSAFIPFDLVKPLQDRAIFQPAVQGHASRQASRQAAYFEQLQPRWKIIVRTSHRRRQA